MPRQTEPVVTRPPQKRPATNTHTKGDCPTKLTEMLLLVVTVCGMEGIMLPSCRFLVRRLRSEFHRNDRRPLKPEILRANAAICNPSSRMNELKTFLMIQCNLRRIEAKHQRQNSPEYTSLLPRHTMLSCLVPSLPLKCFFSIFPQFLDLFLRE